MSGHLHRAVLHAVLPLAIVFCACATSALAAGAIIRTDAVASAMERDVAAQAQTLVLTGPDAACRACHVQETAHYAASGHASLACTECHGAHDGSAQPAGLRTGVPALCRECHSTMDGVWHVTDGQCEDDLTGGPLTCVSSCHDPHGTAFPAMTADSADALCIRCHGGVGVWE